MVINYVCCIQWITITIVCGENNTIFSVEVLLTVCGGLAVFYIFHMGKHILQLLVFLWMFMKSVSENVWGYPGQGYYIEIEIGSPPQKLNVLLDTGSANLAIAAVSLSGVDTFFHSNLSSSFEHRSQSVSVTYTQGTWKGVLGSDLVKVASIHARTVRCDIALIQESEDFFTNGSKWQGILGLGYPVLAQPRGSTTSWLTALPSPSAFSLQLGCCNGRNLSGVHGFLEVLHPPFPETPFRATIVREWFYEVLITGVWINSVSVDVPCNEFNNDKSIVDSGTTNLRLPRKVFEEAVRMINSSVRVHGINVSDTFWVQQSMACFDVKPETIFPSLTIGLARDDGKYFKIVLGPQSYLQRNEESHYQLNCHQLALEPSDTGTVLENLWDKLEKEAEKYPMISKEELRQKIQAEWEKHSPNYTHNLCKVCQIDQRKCCRRRECLQGLVFLEGLKVIFDQESQTVSFSNSSCGPPLLLQGPFVSNSDVMDCKHKDDVASALTAISVTMGAFLSVAAILMTYLACSRFFHRYLCPVKPQWPSRSRSRRELLPGSSDLDLTTAT